MPRQRLVDDESNAIEGMLRRPRRAYQGATKQLRDVTFVELREDTMLAEDVYSTNGTLMLALGHVIKRDVTERLRDMRHALGNRQMRRVRVSDG